MAEASISALIDRLVAINDGNAERAAERIGASVASLSRWRSGKVRPRKQIEDRLRTVVEGPRNPVVMAERSSVNSRFERLEEAISRTINALREEFHRTASVSTRQEVLDLVAALLFAHVTSIDNGGTGIGEHLRTNNQSVTEAINNFMARALSEYLPLHNGDSKGNGRFGVDRFFLPLADADERFASRLLHIFDRDARSFSELHEVGRDDLINEVFSRFMSTSFVDEKEMGQYLTPPEVTRFMAEVGFHALTSDARKRLLNANVHAGIILDPSCGVGSFLAAIIRYCHGIVRQQNDAGATVRWLSKFVQRQVMGIDKSERMIRLAILNLGLFGSKAANLHLANALARIVSEGELCSEIEKKVELILTNPPFGATYSGNELVGFEMGRDRTKAESEVLFLERYIDWLAPNGVVATVVPDSILVNRNAFAELRAWLSKSCNVEAVFSLPTVTFGVAGTNTKTSILVLRKKGPESIDGATYFGLAREVGFDVVTRNGQRRRIRSERSDLPALLAEYKRERPSVLGRWQMMSHGVERWDAAFHVGLPEHIAALVQSTETRFLRVSDVAVLVDDRIDPRRQPDREFNYIEISDIDTQTGLVSYKRILAADAPSRARKLIQVGDVLVSTVRPERGAVGVVPPHLNRAICSTGFAVLRCSAIHPFALAWLLKTELVRQQMMRNNIGIAYPSISDTSCLGLVLPLTRGRVGALTITAQMLAERQEQFESTQRAFFADINELDRAAVVTGATSREIPHVIDGAEPRSVSDST
ncbi:MAG TPA: N-6 DNA methylase [Steroidobacteraceae bacterium]|nr:N-6 DNA methylase [Steroidobacteraceae bacterium]